MQVVTFDRPSDMKLRRSTDKVRELPATPAVEILKSVTPEGIICLFDGVKRRNLASHLRAKYMMTPQQYRAHWKLPDNYPMSLKASAETTGDWDRTPVSEA